MAISSLRDGPERDGPIQASPDPAAPVGCGEFKALFEGVVRQPLPDRLIQLAAALQDALDRGQIPVGPRPRPDA